MSFIESLRIVRKRELHQEKEIELSRIAQEKQIAGEKADEEIRRKLRVKSLRKSIVPQLANELADLVHGRIHSRQNHWATSFDNSESLVLTWSLHTHDYQMGMIVFSGIEDGSISIAGADTIILNSQDAKNFNTFDKAFKHAYQNPKIWEGRPEPDDNGF